MLGKRWMIVGMVTLLQMSGWAYAQSGPDSVVEQYITALSQGRFAEARTLTLESANIDGSIFGSWLFDARGAGLPTATAELFLSQKFVEAFGYAITGTTPVGENQVYVTAIRSSPDVAHLYEWALLPKQGASPYEIITAIDTYLTTVNFPMEESRLRFTLIREVDIWLISAIADARFARLRQLPGGHVAGVAPERSDATLAQPADDGAPEPPPQEPIVTTTSTDVGRLLSDARFHATLQGFNDTFRTPAQVEAAAVQPKPKRRPFWRRLAQRLKLKKPAVQVAAGDMERSLQNIREAISRYTVDNNVPPDESLIRDWQSLRQLVSQHGRRRRQIPDSESAAGFRFVSYVRDADGFILQVEFLSPQAGFTRAEITPYRVTRTY